MCSFLFARKVSLILPLQVITAATPTYCCGSTHCSTDPGCQVPNQYGWPFPYGCLVVDPLNMHVKTVCVFEPPLARKVFF